MPRPPSTRPSSTRPAASQPAASQPADLFAPLTEPYRLNGINVIRLLYHKSPLVIADREEMIAAKYGLEEFRANLSRFEPYIRADADASHFPERREARGMDGELVGGLERETFDGSVLRLEGGVSGSRVRLDREEEELSKVVEGSGAVVRARLEVPFVGSRKRQSRLISQAFQESSARLAMLEYLTHYRTYAVNACAYLRQTLLYLHYIRTYDNQIATLEALSNQPKLPPADRTRVQNALGDSRVVRDGYEASYWTSLLSLLQYLGVKPEERYVLEDSAELPVRYRRQIQSQEGVKQLLEEANANNPKFAVYEDAIRTAELQRTQAILGTFDITAFVEGTQFPFGVPDFDSRVKGWQISAGITVRLNDRRVLTESIKKAEAQIRRYQAQIEAEQADIRNQVAIRAARLRTLYQSRGQIEINIEQTRLQFEERCEVYLGGRPSRLTIDDVLTSLYLLTDADVKLASNLNEISDAENDLLTATGEVYRIVGIRMENRGKGMELSESGLPADNGQVASAK